MTDDLGVAAMKQDGRGRYPVPDPRPPEQVEQDGRTTRLQAAALDDARKDTRFFPVTTRRVLRRRAREGREDVVPVAVLPGGPRQQVAIVQGELIVRTGLDEKTRAVVEEVMGRGSGQEVPGLPGLERFRNASVDGPTLADLAADVRAAGYQASVAHIAPLRGVVKAKGGAGVTAVVADFRHEEVSGGVHVAVIDTGVCGVPRSDGFLSGATDLEGKDAIDPLDVFPLADPGVPGDVDGNGRLDYAAGHGTFVIGVVQQVAPDARVSAYRAIDSDGVGSEVDVAVAMLRAVAAGAQVINLSLGVQTLDDQPLLAVEVALEQIDPTVVVVVAAAGNDGDERPCFPAAQSGVLGVAALSSRDLPNGRPQLARWSSRGFWVDCSAVGEGVVSTYVPGKEEQFIDFKEEVFPDENPWGLWSGTSFAAPQVAGAVARIMEAQQTDAPTALKTLLAGGVPVPDAGRALRIMGGTRY